MERTKKNSLIPTGKPVGVVSQWNESDNNKV